MFIIRPVQSEDLDALVTFAMKADLGIFNLPKDRSLLKKFIDLSLESFSSKTKKMPLERYTFVAVTSDTHEVIGTSSIKVTRPQVEKNCYFHIVKEEPKYELQHQPEVKVLVPTVHDEGSTEVCALYVLTQYRKEQVGKLVALIRYLYMALYVSHFGPHLKVNMRGVVDPDEKSPFWEGWGRHFIDVPYYQVQDLLIHDPLFCYKILPKYPLYISFLNKSAQEAIGKTHRNTIPALNMLREEGFEYTNEIDIIDGGPILSADMMRIRAIKNSKQCKVVEIRDLENNMNEYILTNAKIDNNFRGCYGKAIENIKNEITITPKSSEVLQVGIGDTVTYVSKK